MQRTIQALVVFAAIASVAAGPAAAQNRAALEKTLVANERAVLSAVMEGNLGVFKGFVAEDGLSIDPSGRMPTAEVIRTFDRLRTGMKVKEWDASEFQVDWASADTAIVTYKWTGEGTYMGEPIPSPAWCSTVWTQRDGRWVAVFHQETTGVEVPQ